jgi:glutamate carboxypeptidase
MHFAWLGRGVAVAAAIVFAASGHAALAPEEKALADWLGKRQEEMTLLLERTIKIDSATENHAGVRAVADVFAAELKEAGLTPRWIALPPETKRAGHLFAEHTGTKGKRVLLIGHLDTVLHGGTFTRDGTTARGAGANDIKGGDVVLVYALKALQATGALDDTQIVVAMTGDEESVGSPVEVSRRELIDAAKRSDAVLAFETARNGEATVARRGSSSWTFEVTSPTGHSSGVFSAAMGSGAIYEAARVIDGFHTELRKLPGLTANVATIAGGAEVKTSQEMADATLGSLVEGKNNVIPARAVVHGDLRAVTPEQLEKAVAVMREVAAKNGPRTDVKLSFLHKYPPMAASPRNLELLARLDGVTRDLGQGPTVATDPAQRGAGDSAFAGPYAAVLDGLGVFGQGAHAARENVDLNSLPLQATRTAILIYRLTR